jgi:hypothetical protein
VIAFCVFQTRPADLHNHKQRIPDEINIIPLTMVVRVMESVLNRMHQCISLDGHLTGVIFMK